MNFRLRKLNLPRFISKDRKQLEEFQKELDRPIRSSRYSGNAGVPRVISVRTISTTMDRSDRQISSSKVSIDSGCDQSDRSCLQW